MLTRCGVALLVLASSAFAGTLEVPKDFETIQAAVNAAEDGDTIVVSKGLYPESVLIQDKSDLLLRGAGKPIIKATGHDHGLAVIDCVGIEVRGFVVRNAQASDVFIQTSGSVTITKCRLEAAERNRIKGGGFGVFFVPGTGATTLRNTITGTANVGLRVDGDGCTLDGDRIKSGLAHGLELNGNENVLTDVIVSNAGTNGIDVSGSSNELTGCKALHSGEVGLFVSGTGNAFAKVKAKGSGEFDLQDTDVTDSNTYAVCTFGTVSP